MVHWFLGFSCMVTRRPIWYPRKREITTFNFSSISG